MAVEGGGGNGKGGCEVRRGVGGTRWMGVGVDLCCKLLYVNCFHFSRENMNGRWKYSKHR